MKFYAFGAVAAVALAANQLGAFGPAGAGFAREPAARPADIQRVIAKPPEAVFQALAGSVRQLEGMAGQISLAPGSMPVVASAHIEEAGPASLTVIASAENSPDMHIVLRFDPVDGGRSTNLSVSVDTPDAATPLGQAIGTALVPMLHTAIDRAASRIEAGMPIDTAV